MDYRIFENVLKANKELDEMFNTSFQDKEMVKKIN